MQNTQNLGAPASQNGPADTASPKAEPDSVSITSKVNPTPNENTDTVARDVAKRVAQMIAKEIARTVVKETIRKAVKEADIKEKFPQPSERLQKISEASAIKYVSLYNNYGNVLKPEKKLQLEETIADIRKYSHIIADDYKVLVVDQFNGINRNQAAQLQMKIMECVESYVNANCIANPETPANPAAPPNTAARTSTITPAPAPPNTASSTNLGTNTMPETNAAQVQITKVEYPRFLEMSYVFKCLKIVCVDEFTVKWLKNIIGHLSPSPWKGARLEVTPMSTYSMTSTVLTSTMLNKRTPEQKQQDGRAKFFVPHSKQKLEFDDIMKRIQMCNPSITTDSWTNLKEETVTNGTVYYVSISNDCLKEIRNLNCRLFYFIGILKIVLLDDNVRIKTGKSKIDRSRMERSRIERRKIERSKFK